MELLKIKWLIFSELLDTKNGIDKSQGRTDHCSTRILERVRRNILLLIWGFNQFADGRINYPIVFSIPLSMIFSLYLI